MIIYAELVRINGSIHIEELWYGGDSQKYMIKNLYDNITDDDDSSDTLSLMSMFILDLWTDEIVFEYTGRPMFAEDAYEKIKAGASFVELVTGIIMNGPQFVEEVNAGLVRLLKADGFAHISEAIGSGVKK